MAVSRSKKAASRKSARTKTSAARGRQSTAKGGPSRKTAVARKTSAPRRGSSATTLVCPECGKTFTRAASLGAHRNRAHGVAGSTTAARAGRAAASSPSRGGAQRKTRATGTRATRGTTGLNRDALLGLLFPNGIPAREQVVRDVNAWLDQGEKLARQR